MFLIRESHQLRPVGLLSGEQGASYLDSSMVHLVSGGWKANFIPNQVFVPCPRLISFFPLFSGRVQNLEASHLVLSYCCSLAEV